MSRPELEEAAAAAHRAAERADSETVAERLEKQASQFEDLSTADRGPDHGRLAKHEHVLTEIIEENPDDVAEPVEDALESVRAYRETVDGV